jgi:hypothetical protein
MPDPYERHSRPGRSDYADSQPSRSSAKAAAAQEPQGKRPPGKKNPDLCKAQHWKSGHTGELREVRQYRKKTPGCYWIPSHTGMKPWWHCCHEKICSGCGKILQYGISPRECPFYHELTASELAAIEAETDRIRNLRKGIMRPRITGPQGYRKKKND